MTQFQEMLIWRRGKHWGGAWRCGQWVMSSGGGGGGNCGSVLAPIRSSIDFGKKSYVAAVRNSITVPPLMEIDGSKSARPSKNVNEVVIMLLKEVNLQSLQECRSNLLGKVYFSKRVVSANEVCTQVSDLWKLVEGCRMV
ncbi:hypothetical protein LguiB_021482 [Lonicera macranthoides]